MCLYTKLFDVCFDVVRFDKQIKICVFNLFLFNIYISNNTKHNIFLLLCSFMYVYLYIMTLCAIRIFDISYIMALCAIHYVLYSMCNLLRYYKFIWGAISFDFDVLVYFPYL